MSQVPPIYSAKLRDRRYHNNNRCKERNNIEPENVRSGTGGLPLCEHCHQLNQQGL